MKAQVAGRAVLLIPHRGETGDEAAARRLSPDPGDRAAAGGPVQVKSVGAELGLEPEFRSWWA